MFYLCLCDPREDRKEGKLNGELDNRFAQCLNGLLELEAFECGVLLRLFVVLNYCARCVLVMVR